MLAVVAEGWQGTEGIQAAVDRVSCWLLMERSVYGGGMFGVSGLVWLANGWFFVV